MNESDYVKLLVEETPDALIATSPDGKVLYWSRGAETTFGYAGAEAVGRSLDELVVPADQLEKQHALWQEAREKGVAIYECMRRRKDGSLIYVNTATHAVRDAAGRVAWFVTNKRDITIQKAMRDSTLLGNRYREQLEWTPDSLIIVNSTGRIVLANRRAEMMFGYLHEELLGMALEKLLPARFHERHAAHRADYFMRPRSRPMGGDLELYGLRKDGEEFPVEISLSPLQTDEGVLAVSSIRDITERKRFELSLQKANQMKSQFLAGMSHELRTPLNGIIGFTEFLIDEKPGPLNPKQKEYLTDVYSSALHLLQLINDVLDLAKVEAGRVDLSPVTFRPATAIKEVCAVVNGIAHKKGIVVRPTADPGMEEVTLDQQKFKQVCYNLLANAVKFTDPGGTVDIHVAPCGESRFQVQVKDTGIGIKEEDFKRLFREFEQLESGTTRRFEGTGLGLALTRKLVECQGGSIEVESDYGRGSTFTVTLPMTYKGEPIHG